MKRSTGNRRKLVLAGLAAFASQVGVGRAHAQDPARVMPRTYRIAFENEHVRVLEFTARPGMGICGEGMHSHPARVSIVMNGWQSRSSTPNSPAKTWQTRDGDVIWGEPVTHKVENIGKTNSRVLIVELKSLAKVKG